MNEKKRSKGLWVVLYIYCDSLIGMGVEVENHMCTPKVFD